MKRYLSIAGVLILIATMVLLLSACQGGNAVSDSTGAEGSSSGGSTSDSESGNSEDTQPVEPTPTPEEMLPDTLVLHPDAYDMDFSESSGTYVYYVPMMVKEAAEYLLVEHEAKGWERLGTPVIMGHLATLNMKMGENRLTISMQDNELSETTRVQMLIIQ
ncbi:MAG: hypothetical protein E4H27_00880 [Anaerolineales bacterium]|nr:MAG: hypothetical protein E4H27_00880 [Anaerolineales bacterium]